MHKKEITTVILADTSSHTEWSTNTRTHKIDCSTFKPLNMIQAIKSGKKCLLRDFIPLPRLYQVSINVFI